MAPTNPLITFSSVLLSSCCTEDYCEMPEHSATHFSAYRPARQ
jgi:hypothetical protein